MQEAIDAMKRRFFNAAFHFSWNQPAASSPDLPLVKEAFQLVCDGEFKAAAKIMRKTPETRKIWRLVLS